MAPLKKGSRKDAKTQWYLFLQEELLGVLCALAHAPSASEA